MKFSISDVKVVLLVIGIGLAMNTWGCSGKMNDSHRWSYKTIEYGFPVTHRVVFAGEPVERSYYDIYPGAIDSPPMYDEPQFHLWAFNVNIVTWAVLAFVVLAIRRRYVVRINS